MQRDRDEESTPAGAGAGDRRDDAGAEGAGSGAGEGEDEAVLTLVCLKCGTEYYFTDEAPPSDLTCGKCGNTVFRHFHSDAGDEAARDFRETTDRDLDTDDAEGDTLPGDLIDLNRD